jgi:hypothetical protein
MAEAAVRRKPLARGYRPGKSKLSAEIGAALAKY